nr:EpsG family protein [uncultured Vibrio sp.]
MILYIVIYFILASLSLLYNDRSYKNEEILLSKISINWYFLLILFTIIIGFRHEIGPDWIAYVGYFERASHFSFFDVFINKDPGYQLLNYISNILGFGIYGVNLACGFIFSLGLIVFCLKQERPYLALTVSFPYLFLVVGMGYTRQAVAIGFVMMAITALQNSKIYLSILLVVFSVTVHKSAVLIIPLIFLVIDSNKYIKYLAGVVITFSSYILFLDDHVDDLVYIYVESERYSSNGTLMRLLMSLIPSCIFLIFRDRLNLPLHIKKLWTLVSCGSFLLTIIFFISNLSTAIDRVALYLIPIQLVVFSSLPEAFTSMTRYRVILILSVIIYYFLILVLWFGLSSHATSWTPYVFYPFWYLNSTL